MNFKEYKKLWALPADIKARERRIERMISKQENNAVVQDTVQGSGECFPYTKRAVVICGMETRVGINAMQARLQALNDEYSSLYNRALIEIEDIDDPEVRVAVFRRYIECWSWEDIADELALSRDGDTVRKAVERYFKKNNIF